MCRFVGKLALAEVLLFVLVLKVRMVVMANDIVVM